MHVSTYDSRSCNATYCAKSCSCCTRPGCLSSAAESKAVNGQEMPQRKSQGLKKNAIPLVSEHSEKFRTSSGLLAGMTLMNTALGHPSAFLSCLWSYRLRLIRALEMKVGLAENRP